MAGFDLDEGGNGWVSNYTRGGWVDVSFVGENGQVRERVEELPERGRVKVLVERCQVNSDALQMQTCQQIVLDIVDDTVRKSLLGKIDKYLVESVEKRCKVKEAKFQRNGLNDLVPMVHYSGSLFAHDVPILITDVFFLQKDDPNLTTTTKPTELSIILFELSRYNSFRSPAKCRALAEMNMGVSASICKLIELLEDKYIPHRTAAISALSSLTGHEPCFGSESEPVLPCRLNWIHVTVFVTDKFSHVKDNFNDLSKTLCVLYKPDGKEAFRSTLEKLIARFQNHINTCYFKEAALQAMSCMGLEMQRGQNTSVMRESQDLLEFRLVQDLVKQRDSENMFVRIAILQLFGCFCLKGSFVIDFLIHSIGDEEQAVRAQALQAISSLAEHGVITGEDSDTRNIRERLLPHMKHENWEIRRIAISAARFLFAKGSPSTRFVKLNEFFNQKSILRVQGRDECLAAGLRDSHEVTVGDCTVSPYRVSEGVEMGNCGCS
eukprot:766643-Hanusia_phi.AAC.11